VSRVLTEMILVIVIAAPCLAQGRAARKPAAADDALVSALELKLTADQNDNRISHLEVLAPEFTFIKANGRALTRTEFIEDFRSGRRHNEKYSTRDVQVRVYGASALVSGVVDVVLQRKVEGVVKCDGEDVSGRYRFNKVFVKRAGRWQCVIWQVTKIGENMEGELETKSGLKFIDLVEGSGASPSPGQVVSVHYTGTLENGQKFDSSLDRGAPFEFKIGVGQVIRGWDEGVMTRKIGGKRKLIMPAELGYGARGAGGVIPPNATLIFEVELLDVK